MVCSFVVKINILNGLAKFVFLAYWGQGNVFNYFDWNAATCTLHVALKLMAESFIDQWLFIGWQKLQVLAVCYLRTMFIA